MNDNPRVLILIVNWNNYPDTKACLESLSKLTYENYQVMVVDNGSSDGSSQSIRKNFPNINLVELDENLGFAGGNNVGLEYALKENFPFILLLNNDTTVLNNDFLGSLVQILTDEKKIGAVGPDVEQSDGKTQLSILPYPSLVNTIRNTLGLYDPDHTKGQYVDSIAGCCVLVRRDAVKMAGILDDNYFMYGEETEWFYRMRKNGWSVLYHPVKSIVHKGAASIEMLERQDFYIECRVNLIYTLVKHEQKVQAFFTIPLMMTLLFLRSLKSKFDRNQNYPLIMLKDFWKAAVSKWKLASGSRKYLQL